MRAQINCFSLNESRSSQSFIGLFGACVSSLRKTNDGVEIRIYNPTDREVEVALTGFDGRIFFTDFLSGNRQKTTNKFSLGAYKIQTMLLIKN